MSTRKAQIQVAGFINGLNTEATALNMMPNEFIDGSTNVELLQNGSVRRRKGVDFLGTASGGAYMETLRTASSVDTKQDIISAIRVKLTAPSGGVIERIIVAANNSFKIYKVTNASLRNSGTPYQTISFGTHASSNQMYANMQFAVSGNKCFFAGKFINPGYMYVDADNDSLAVTFIDVLIRDTAATALNKRVSNGGSWYECIEAHTSSASNEPGVGADWTRYWMLLDGATASGVPAWGSGTSYTCTITKQYDKNRTVTTYDTFPTSVEFFGGRIWLAGDVKNPNSVFFSRVITKDSDISRFLQYADPYDPNDPDVVDDDGGVIKVQGAGLIRRMLAVTNSIFLGTISGIWQVSGDSSVFKATNFSNVLVLTDGIDGIETMVRTDREIIVFGQSSIWRSFIDTSLTSTTSGQAIFKSVSEGRIDTLYANIPAKSKAASRAIYNQTERRVYLFYNSTRTDFDLSYNPDDQAGYAKDILVIDTRFEDSLISSDDTNKKRTVKGAFWTYALADGAATGKPYITCPFICKDVPASNSPVVAGSSGAVTVDAVSVVTASNEQAKDVILFMSMQRITSGTFTVKTAFGTFNTAALQDWASSDTYAVSYTSRIVCGTQVFSDLLHKKAATYIGILFKRIESGDLDVNGEDITPGGCFMRTAWGFSTSALSSKYGGAKQVYYPDRFTYSYSDGGLDGTDHVTYKHRVRGRGMSLNIILENDGDKDFHVVGWTEQLYSSGDGRK